MDIKTLLDNLHEEVSCSVCKNTFTEPKQLPCLHNFCLKCLTGVQRTSGRHNIITCPECRRKSKVPGGGNLKELPTNFHINCLLDVLAIKECNATGVKCGNCEKTSAQSVYCFQCCTFWCDECVIGHNIIRANKEHRVLALKDFEDQDIENVLKRPAFCPRHKKKELEFFCKSCKETICTSCVVTAHDGHVKILLEEAAYERKVEVVSLVESHKRKAQEMRNNISKLEQKWDKIQAKAANAKRSAHQFAESMIAVIQSKKQEIFNEVEHKSKESLELLRLQRNEMEHKVKIIDTAVEKTETLLKRSTNAELVQLDESLTTIFQEGNRDETLEVDCDLKDNKQLVFIENETLMAKTISEGIGSLKTFSKTQAQTSVAEGEGISKATVGIEANFVLTTKNAEGEQCYEERDCVTVEIKNHKNQQGHDCATEVRIQDNKDGSYKISYFAKETGKCDASVKVNEEHVRKSPFAVRVKPRQFRPVLSFGLGMLNNPWGVAVNERNEIAVTEFGDHRVQVFRSDGTYLRSFGREGEKLREFDHPTGIAFDSNGNIIVADAHSRIQIFSDQGVYLKQFGGLGNLDHQLNAPHGLSVDNDGNIIVADRFNKLIKIFSSGGQYLRKLGDVGCFTFPFHCVQHDKYFIVSDREEQCIKVFDADGDSLYKFGKKGEGDGQINEPSCLSVNKAGHLMVCDTGNHRVQVFELSGKFITKFGTKGSEMGQFNAPVSTAVLSDGRIVVSDFSNHRIQIFE